MRLTLLVNYDLASNIALHYLLPKLDKHSITIFYTDKQSSDKSTPLELKKLSKYERSIFQLTKLDLLTNTALGAQKINNINDGDGFEQYCLSQPDLVISIRHMTILKPVTIASPKFGVINLHSGLLPRYRGVMATFWALLNKEQDIGTTLHFIDNAGIDNGRIITRSRTAARFDQSYLWNMLHLYKDGCTNIVNAIATISNTGALPTEAQTGKANYFSLPTQQALDDFDQPLFKQTDRQSIVFDGMPLYQPL